MSQSTTKKQSLSFSWQLCIAFVLAAAALTLPDLAAAQQTNTPFGAMFCTVKNWFLGNTGKGLATIAITVIGIGALLGKVSWGMALIVGTGVAIIFGAANIVDAMSPDAAGARCDTTGFENAAP